MIELIVFIPKETLERISPRTASLKSWVKAPMVFNVMLTGMLASLVSLANKFIGELILAGNFWEHWLMMACCFVVSGLIVPFLILLRMTRVQMFY